MRGELTALVPTGSPTAAHRHRSELPHPSFSLIPKGNNSLSIPRMAAQRRGAASTAPTASPV